MKAKKVLFIDRDGTLIREPADQQIDAFEKLEFCPGVFTWLGRIARELDYELVMVTNQDGLGTSAFPEADFWPVQELILRCFESEGVAFSEVLIDRTFPADNAPTRKPGTGLLTAYFSESYDLAGSYVIGDRLTDMELAKNLGGRGIFLDQQTQLGLDELTASEKDLEAVMAWKGTSWKGIYEFLALPGREVSLTRKTAETDIEVRLNLDGRGTADIQTGLAFFDHMLDQLARHGQLDLYLRTRGDLHVDEHHTIEDTAIALGEAFHRALRDKLGMERYGFCLPMDDCLARVSLDFGGRNWLVWEAEFRREKIGDMPTEMFFHFFKSFSDSARANLNISAEGQNEHHKIEAIFKAFAKAIKMAVRRDPEKRILPSTKGML
ncbi:bifunctional histidinol-phosphatase/imidazoleglycerol-phosphate dehydratase HisB [Robiginitalea marina]|uniref:Histidine biosynthesis bifunctional protein HisB n=1 Tax=Robiginitalea marina TaxID=2954105 RepID=A0ABT1AVD0_9FLAO|nr:bifunctional histidinol-phosphatase/imidazoleglycerol-phosphate dehydratase HisB [Robiginitalea marina]MCO5723567.1 bifunctional histidinol-phosphatase/imidazoleglycerol-phosphate dehydratase HisB [Robiginitalea marina]